MFCLCLSIYLPAYCPQMLLHIDDPWQSDCLTSVNLSIDCIDPFSATYPYCEGSSLRRDLEAFLSGDATLKLILWSSTESTFRDCPCSELCSQREAVYKACVTTSLWPLLVVLLSLCLPATKESKIITLLHENTHVWDYCTS